MGLRPGDVIGSYEVLRRLGAGGTAEVFEVRHTVLGTRSALKVLLPTWVEDEAVRARFLQEGRIQARLDHPGVVRVTDTVAEPGVAGLVMELLEGESLRERIEREGPPDPKQAVAWVRAALDAVQAAHALGITHRDLKPENLFLERHPAGERLRVLDFGIAKAPEAANHTAQRGALGTCAYMSPEQVRDPASVDPRTDVFALGVVLWELLVGRPPFEGATAFDTMQRVLTQDPGPPSAKRAGLPSWLDRVTLAALAKVASQRIPSAEAFAAALDAGPRGAALPVAQGRPLARRVGGCGVALWLGLLGGLGLLAVGGGAALVGLVLLAPTTAQPPTASSDPCGHTTVQFTARGRSGEVVLLADGVPVQQWPLGAGTYVHAGPLPLGQQVELSVVSGGKVLASSTHAVGGAPTTLAVQVPSGARAGAVGRTLVRAQGSCVPDGLTWEARVDGERASGDLPASGEIWLDTQGLGVGLHLVEVQLQDPLLGRTVATGQAQFTVAEPPPPGDFDQDGYMSRSAGGDDCDDTNPAVNPGVPESSVPNGLDDNCDGRIDEGTVAFDDDGDGLSEAQGDCDDTDPKVYPGAPELPDCRDQDCDGEIDEGLTRPARDDVYEPNGTQAQAWDLRTSTKRSFAQTLDLVAADGSDEAWFRFYSQDGDWDDWGIDVTAQRIPSRGSVRLEVIDRAGSSRGVLVATRDGETLRVRGKPFRNDSGDYLLRVSPVALPGDWCPIEIGIVSR